MTYPIVLSVEEHPVHTLILRQQGIIETATAKIATLTLVCDHPEDHVKTVNKSDTGNMDRNDDTYYREVTCSVCGKRWYFSKNTGRQQPEVLDHVTYLKLPIA